MKADKTIASKQNRVAQSPATVTSTAGFAAPKPKAQSDFARPALYYSLANIQLLATDTATGLSAERVGEIAATGVNGTPRPLPYFNRVQQAFGKHDISHVQTYADGQAIQAAKSIGAEAYASGHKIAFANTNPSLHTVAHEAAHIVQQQAGVHLKGGVGQAGDKYEQHADRVADAVVAGKSAENLLSQYSTGDSIPCNNVQRADQPVQLSGRARKVKKPVNYHEQDDDDLVLEEEEKDEKDDSDDDYLDSGMEDDDDYLDSGMEDDYEVKPATKKSRVVEQKLKKKVSKKRKKAEELDEDAAENSASEEDEQPSKKKIKKSKPKASKKLSEQQSDTLTKKLATEKNHRPLTREKAQSGYMRSSENSHINHQTTPLNPSVRNPDAIGSIPQKNQAMPIDGMKQGFSLPIASQMGIIGKVEEARKDLAGQGYKNNDRENVSDEDWYAEHESGTHMAADFTFSKIELSEDFAVEGEWRPLNVNRHLAQRYAICQDIQKQTVKFTHVFIAAENNYPCLGVGVTIPSNLNKTGKNAEVELWTVFCMYVFLGICKAGERENGFQVMARSSFGHVESTLADCYQVFRINVGLIGPKEIERLVGYLQKLDDYLQELLGKDKPELKEELYTSKTEVAKTLFSTDKANNTSVLFAKDKKQLKFMNLVHRIVNAIESEKDGNLLKTLIEDQALFTKEIEKLTDIADEHEIDEDFQKVLEEYYGVKFKERLTYENYADKLREYIGGLIYNEYVAGHTFGGDGYGSDSDEELDIGDKHICAKKIVLPWGMRAIVCAMDVVRHFDKTKEYAKKVDYSTMYYETADIKQAWLSKGEKTKKKTKKKQYLLGLKDLNYFYNRHSIKDSASSASSTSAKKEDVRYQIWDVTSADEQSIADLAMQELVDNAELQYILLVSSGTKNEYFGLDIGGHGTLRIIAKDKELRDKIYKYVTEYAHTKTPWFNNQLRRGFKEKFGVISNKGILALMAGKKIGNGSNSDALDSMDDKEK